MNPMSFLQLKTSFDQFKFNHPKFIQFIKALSKDGALDEGTLVEISVTTTAGKTVSSNIRLKESDLEFLRSLKDTVES